MFSSRALDVLDQLHVDVPAPYPTPDGPFWRRSPAPGKFFHSLLGAERQVGVAGVIGGFFTVVEVAKIISFWPGFRALRNYCKINDCIWPNFRGFLATLITMLETGL